MAKNIMLPKSALHCPLNNLFRKDISIGATIIEFAIILPLFLALVFGIIEFGVLLFEKAVLTDACREGARAGILSRYPRNEEIVKNIVFENVTKYCENNLISFKEDYIFSEENILVTPNNEILNYENDGKTLSDPQLIDSGETLSVEVTYDFEFLVFSNILSLVGGPFENGITLTAKSVMRFE